MSCCKVELWSVEGREGGDSGEVFEEFKTKNTH